MKFSKKKKAKMKKRVQRYIRRHYGDITGCYIDSDHERKIIDQSVINNIIYLLVETKDKQYEIFKIVRIAEYTKISKKNIMKNQQDFCNHANWYKHSQMYIVNGNIQNVKEGTYFGP